jgi:hypothetical protein
VPARGNAAALILIRAPYEEFLDKLPQAWQYNLLRETTITAFLSVLLVSP